MRVRILSGSEAGTVVDLPTPVAQADVATGFAELVDESLDSPAAAAGPPAAPSESATEAEPEARRSKKEKAK